MRTVAFCEINPFCRQILAKHWPGIPIWDDVRKLHASDVQADIICGGFPCQDISYAGQGDGIDGDRSGLWREFARLIGEIRPQYAIVENVAALLTRGLGRVLGDLAALRYDAEWHCIPASYVGAPHIRDRIWVVAYPQDERDSGEVRYESGEQDHQPKREFRRSRLGTLRPSFQWSPEPAIPRVVDGVSPFVDEIMAYGNAVVPQIVEIIGRAILEAESSK